MRARVARPRGHRPRRGGPCLARAHAPAPARAGRVQPALVVDARRRRDLQRRRPPALGAVRREPDPPAERGRRPTRWSAPRPTRGWSRRQALEASIRADVARPTEATAPASAERPVSFFCAEFGIHASLPIYSGGLGVLAGDILKEASDRALPLVAVGLLYRQGYFRQRIDASGWQHESWVPTDPERLPCALVTGDGRRADHGRPSPSAPSASSRRSGASTSGRVPLFLLDADRPENGAVGALDHLAPLHRRSRDLRLAQYAAARRRRHARAAGAGHRPVGRPPQRGARRASPRSSWPARELDAGRVARARRWPRPARASCSRPTRRCRRATTPTSPSGSLESSATLADELGVDPTRIVGLGRTRPDDDGEPVRRDAVRPAHEPLGQRREPPPRRGGARDVGRAVARSRGRRGADRPRHQRRPPPHLDGRADARRCSIATSATGWMDRAADQAAWDAARRRRRRRAVGGALRAARRARWPGRASAAWSTACGRDEPRDYVEARGASTPTC